MNRRKFLKTTGYTIGGIAAAAGASPLAFPEKDAHFDPNDSFWAKELLPPNPSLKKNMSADVAIIGGGYTGLSAACHLKKYMPALNIVLLEAKHIAHGASGRHGGMVLTQPPTDSFEIAHEEEPELHKAVYNFTVGGIQNIRDIVEKSGLDCDLKLDGFCHTILDGEDIPYYRDYVNKVRKMGMPLEFWDETKTAASLGTEYYAASVYDPNGGSVHAVKLANALKKTALERGVVIFENTRVDRIHEGKEIELSVNGAYKVRASKLILATNAYTSKLGYFKSRIIPVHAQTAVTEPLSQEIIEEIGWESRLPFFDSRNYLIHVVLRDDNRIVIGGGDAEYYFRGDLRYHGDLNKVRDLTKTELTRIFPALANVKLEYVWNGLLGMTSDEVPRVGVTSDDQNVYFGLAYNGQGVNMSCMFGDILASVIAGRNHGWEKTSYYNYDGGFSSYVPPEPFRWIGATFLMKYLKNQDTDLTK